MYVYTGNPPTVVVHVARSRSLHGASFAVVLDFVAAAVRAGVPAALATALLARGRAAGHAVGRLDAEDVTGGAGAHVCFSR